MLPLLIHKRCQSGPELRILILIEEQEYRDTESAVSVSLPGLLQLRARSVFHFDYGDNSMANGDDQIKSGIPAGTRPCFDFPADVKSIQVQAIVEPCLEFEFRPGLRGVDSARTRSRIVDTNGESRKNINRRYRPIGWRKNGTDRKLQRDFVSVRALVLNVTPGYYRASPPRNFISI